MLETLVVNGNWALWWNREASKSDTWLRVTATYYKSSDCVFGGEYRGYKLEWNGTRLAFGERATALNDRFPGALLTITMALAAAGVKP